MKSWKDAESTGKCHASIQSCLLARDVQSTLSPNEEASHPRNRPYFTFITCLSSQVAPVHMTTRFLPPSGTLSLFSTRMGILYPWWQASNRRILFFSRSTTQRQKSSQHHSQIKLMLMRIDMTLAYPAALTLQNLERSFTLSRPPNAYAIIQVSNQVASTVHSLAVPGQRYLHMHIPVLNFGCQPCASHVSVTR